MLPNNLKVKLHEHPLTKRTTNLDGGWSCNGAHETEGCYSGITEFYMSSNV